MSVQKKFPIAAIGASAGGVEAISELLKYLPARTGIAFVYIQHLSPTSESNLTAIVKRLTQIPVLMAEDQLKIEPDHLYIIPPDKQLTIEDGLIVVSPRPSLTYRHMPVNVFFKSLAEKYQESAIGIVLSGTDSDGAIGSKAIKMAGGITFAQDETAQFTSMPRNAHSEGGIDLVLSPKEIAEELVKIGRQKDVYYAAINELNETTIEKSSEDLSAILLLLNRSSGADFSLYKMSTVKRRIIRRMMLYKMDTLKDYLKYLKQHTAEVNLLYQDLLINVTTFFRDPDTSEYLKKHIFPKILSRKNQNDPIRIWVPACSTGQEAYSLAMLLVEILGDQAPHTPIQIFGTDLSETAINKARLAIYNKDEIVDIPPKRLQRFFTRVDGSYRVLKSLRDLCVFATHNITKDPPFSRLDLISCCNVLIYMDSALQKKVISTFHYSLNNDGFLVLGKSETVGNASYLFSQVEKKFRIYSKKKDVAAKAMFEMNYRLPEAERFRIAEAKTASGKARLNETEFEKAIDNLLLKKYAPASVVVNADLDIVQFRGSTGLYLEPLPGKASLNLLKMARLGLTFELRNVVHKVKKTGKPARKIGLEISIEGKQHKVAIEALPIKDVPGDEYFLVVFEDMEISKQEDDLMSIKDRRVQQLESELNALREDMRSIVEAQEAANEELQSANEEIVSSNEELQSINEELETSKEEIESSNEELITINQELQIRNEQLVEEQEYSQAVFTTIRECLLVLNKDRRVTMANDAFYRTFRLSERDVIGKVLYDLGHRDWNIPEMHQLIDDKLSEAPFVSNYELKHHFKESGEKTLLINARKIPEKSHQREIILLAIEDMTQLPLSPQ